MNPFFSDDEVDVLCGGPMLLFKVIRIGYPTPYGGAPATGLTNLLYEVALPHVANPACNLSTPSVLDRQGITPRQNIIHAISFLLPEDTLLRYS